MCLHNLGALFSYFFHNLLKTIEYPRNYISSYLFYIIKILLTSTLYYLPIMLNMSVYFITYITCELLRESLCYLYYFAFVLLILLVYLFLCIFFVWEKIQCGNVTNLREAGWSPEESSLFFVKVRMLWNGSSSKRGVRKKTKTTIKKTTKIYDA